MLHLLSFVLLLSFLPFASESKWQKGQQQHKTIQTYNKIPLNCILVDLKDAPVARAIYTLPTARNRHR